MWLQLTLSLRQWALIEYGSKQWTQELSLLSIFSKMAEKSLLIIDRTAPIIRTSPGPIPVWTGGRDSQAFFLTLGKTRLQLLTRWVSNSSFHDTAGHIFGASAERFPAQMADRLSSEMRVMMKLQACCCWCQQLYVFSGFVQSLAPCYSAFLRCFTPKV